LGKSDLLGYLKAPVDKFMIENPGNEDLGKDLGDFLEPFKQVSMKISENLTCPISLEIMTNPVVLSSGHTYEKDEIEKYFTKHGRKDPMTDEAVQGPLIENINLRHAIEHFIEDHPWSYQHSESDNYHNILFKL
jgi:hypothetical protein